MSLPACLQCLFWLAHKTTKDLYIHINTGNTHRITNSTESFSHTVFLKEMFGGSCWGMGASCTCVYTQMGNVLSKGFGRKGNEAAVSKFCHRFRVVTQPTAHIQACDIKSSLLRILQTRENEFFCFHLPSLKRGALNV